MYRIYPCSSHAKFGCCGCVVSLSQPPPQQSRVYQTTQLRNHSLPRSRRRRASSPQRSSSNGCCFFRYHGPFFVRLSFPTPTNGTLLILIVVDMCHTGCRKYRGTKYWYKQSVSSKLLIQTYYSACCPCNSRNYGDTTSRLYTYQMPIPLVVTRGTKVSGSHHGDNPLLKPNGIQIATKSLPGPTNREHRNLIGVKTIS